MFKSVKVKLIAAVGAVALCSLTALLTAIAPPAKAAQTQDTVQSHTKGDRLPMPSTGAACSSFSWPHYEQSCQFDLSRSGNAARAVRVLDLSRDAQFPNKKTISLR
jgi:hypothetical protein